MREMASGSRRMSRLKRLVITVVAAALLAIIVGSLALIYSQAHPQTSVGSRNNGGSITATPVQASATPIPASLTPQPTGTALSPTGTPNVQGSRYWPVGQDTYWANLRYHQLTGSWVSWFGLPYQWVAGARKAGWHVSTSPHVPSIVVLMPSVQGAGSSGHVAVVESLVNATTVHTSNMNWWYNGGGFNKVSYSTFTAGSGVCFLWRS